MNTRYITSAAKAEQLPDYETHEIAFIGRSNAGKSTMLNAIMGRKSLARAGRTPGLTKMVNFFGYGDTRIFADLPGYGYHAAHNIVSKDWDDLVTAYLRRPNIRDFVFLIDIRRKPNSEDLSLIYQVARQLPIIVALTKCDKINKSQRTKAVKELNSQLEELGIETKQVLAISSPRSIGIEKLKQLLLQ
tara:strand:- start:29 stop:595 length:567 start_codon:yes stop_codon:yes gene_type:complete